MLLKYHNNVLGLYRILLWNNLGCKGTHVCLLNNVCFWEFSRTNCWYTCLWTITYASARTSPPAILLVPITSRLLCSPAPQIHTRTLPALRSNTLIFLSVMLTMLYFYISTNTLLAVFRISLPFIVTPQERNHENSAKSQNTTMCRCSNIVSWVCGKNSSCSFFL